MVTVREQISYPFGNVRKGQAEHWERQACENLALPHQPKNEGCIQE